MILQQYNIINTATIIIYVISMFARFITRIHRNRMLTTGQDILFTHRPRNQNIFPVILDYTD